MRTVSLYIFGVVGGNILRDLFLDNSLFYSIYKQSFTVCRYQFAL